VKKSLLLILPLLPFYAATFDASPALVGLLLAGLIIFTQQRILRVPDFECPSLALADDATASEVEATVAG